MKVAFHPRVFSEIDAIMRYYEEVADTRLADDFYVEFRHCILQAAAHPGRFQERLGGYKRANMRRFPYNILFRERGDHIRVLVVRHHARHPAVGTKRK